MARSLWTGSLSFGLVNVPVALFSGVRDRDVHFHQLHEPDGARIEQRRFCAEEDREVPLEEIGHAYDLDGQQVVVTDEDLEAVAPEKTRTIDIQAFVDLDAIDPLLFDHPYLLLPTGDAEGPRRAYRLLVEALEAQERVALGRFVLRTKEHLAAVRVRDGLLALTTMLFGDELRPTTGIDTGGRKPTKAALDQAVRLLDALTVDWDPSQYRDRYRDRLRAVIRRKEKGHEITAAEPEPEPKPAADLLDALRASLRRIEGGGDGGADGDGVRGDGSGDGRADGAGSRARAADGSRDGEDLTGLSRDELYARAQDADVPGRSSMTKDELVKALTS